MLSSTSQLTKRKNATEKELNDFLILIEEKLESCPQKIKDFERIFSGEDNTKYKS